MKIGILGGTFNPPHLGHLVLAQEALDKYRLEKILFIPTNIPPHKQGDLTPPKARLEMLKLAIADKPKFEVSDLEIIRPGVSYTIDTIKALKKQCPNDDFFLIIGSDLSENFSTWKNYKEIKNQVEIIVARRKDYPSHESQDFIYLDITFIDLSSSEIRSKIANNCPLSDLVKPEVADYIYKNKLYLNAK
tara:strand:- start:955 stop:1524 length:570 start_codon:yes stop_codon:yes gene_type:complete